MASRMLSVVRPYWEGMLPEGRSTWRDYMVLTSGCVLGAGVVWSVWRYYTDRRLPPGPTGWPLVGFKFKLERDGMKATFGRCHRQYGDVTSVRHGYKLLIVLSSHSVIKEALVIRGDEFAHRPIMKTLPEFKLEDDIFSTPYSTPGWNANKSMLMSCLRSAGYGPTGAVEDKVLEQVELLVSHLEQSVTQQLPVDFQDILSIATLNVISQVIMNKKFDYDDPHITDLQELITNMFGFFFEARNMSLGITPLWLKHILYKEKVESAVQKRDSMRNYLKSEIEKHTSSHDPAHPRDFIDVYLTKARGQHSLTRMVDNIIILIPDATDTLSMAIKWVFLYLTHYQPVQEAVAKEINDLTGSNRPVSWADRSFLHYTEATIMEILRVSPPVNYTPEHMVAHDVEFRGYHIPAGSHIFINLIEAHRDPDLFEDPEIFRPERHLDADGKLVKTDQVIPFSMGRRKCPGEQLGKMELFLFVSNLVQKYHIEFQPGHEASLEGEGDMLNICAPYKVLLSHR